jgi:hypothetical protein
MVIQGSKQTRARIFRGDTRGSLALMRGNCCM